MQAICFKVKGTTSSQECGCLSVFVHHPAKNAFDDLGQYGWRGASYTHRLVTNSPVAPKQTQEPDLQSW